MAHHKLEINAKCKECDGTGIYVGFAERNGAGVVCSKCKGKGSKLIVVEYDDAEPKQIRTDVSRVYETNPGYFIGEGITGQGTQVTLDDFGGMPYYDWVDGKPFPPKSEMRKITCPCQWYQITNYKQKPEWDECLFSLGRTFSKCDNFQNKYKCWERWDREFGSK